MAGKYRSQRLYDQIKAFEDKIYLAYDQFNVDILHRMIVELGKRTVVDIRRIKSLAQLRQCFQDQTKNLHCKLRHRHVNATREEERIVKYFTWFFQFFEFVREMRNNFVNRIYNPLFKYFYNIGYDTAGREGSTASDSSTSESATSFRSHYSSHSGLTGITSVLADIYKTQKSHETLSARSARSDADQINDIRRSVITKNALLALGQEFQDINLLYDTSELKKLAHRLSHLKERIDFLINSESKIDNALLCQDSERCVFPLRIKEAGIESLVRLLPDILIKFQKASWLAKRWLERDAEKTTDLNEKLKKIRNLENEMGKRMESLYEEIQDREKKLEFHSLVLNRLLEREDRVNTLRHHLFNLQNKKHALNLQFQILQKERNILAKKLAVDVPITSKATYKAIRTLYERNKLQRFAVDRHLATIDYDIGVTEEDVTIELEMRPSVINSTNDVQDHCEALELRIEKARKERKVIQAALIPIAEDKVYITRQIQINAGEMRMDESNALKAEFVGTFVKCNKPTPEEIGGLNKEYISDPRGNAVSLFITAVPDDTQVSPPHQHMTSLGNNNKSITSLLPEVAASEW